ncbi:MAG: class I SAM-dependent methyltransferase, partial [Myxococcota bacterium]|nr:class I SAM-dependent methyltransferase [Myxococcota bacterium]
MGWESPGAQHLRHQATLESLSPLSGIRSLLDVGCGEGALLTHLQASGYSGSYQGEDVLVPMIDRARHAHPSADFHLRDSLEHLEMADAVVCCGALNTGMGDPAGHQRGLAHLWERTRRVLVVIVAVDDRHHAGSMLTPASIGALWQTTRDLTSCSSVREDLNPGEAMFTLWRDRSATLARLVAGEERVMERAEIHTAAQEPRAVLEELGHLRSTSPMAALRWAQAAERTGRIRDAEKALRDLVEVPEVQGEAQVALSTTLLNTGRQEEAVTLLTSLVERTGDHGDPARMLLVRHSLNLG